MATPFIETINVYVRKDVGNVGFENKICSSAVTTSTQFFFRKHGDDF